MATVTEEQETTADISWEFLRQRISESVEERGEWAGAPLPVSGHRLVVEPRYPYQGLNGMQWDESKDESEVDNDGATICNSWHSWKRNARVIVIRDKNGRATVAVRPEVGGNRLLMQIDTAYVGAQAWSIPAEAKAVQKLSELITGHAFRMYFLGGTFLETSPKSGMTYVFRRLRPTLAIKAHGDSMRIVSVLCLHPIGYYEGTWAGCMVPTDEVIAHLMLMRGDERRFWSKANHHPVWAEQSGL